jgi:hypothetical protein
MAVSPVFSRAGVPVFLDLLYEETCSPVLSFTILLKMSKAATFGLFQAFNPQLTCFAVAAQGAQVMPTGSQAALYIMACVSVLAGGASVLRWQPAARWLPMGWLLLVGYLITFAILEMQPCVAALPLAKSNPGQAPVVAFVATLAFYNLCLIVTMVLCSARQCVSQWRAIAEGKPKAFPPRDVRAVRPPPAPTPGAFGRLTDTVKHWGRVAAVAPLRHKVAVCAASLLLLTATIVLFTGVAFARLEWNKILAASAAASADAPPSSCTACRHLLRQLLQEPPPTAVPAPVPAPGPSPGSAPTPPTTVTDIQGALQEAIGNFLHSLSGPIAAALDAAGVAIIGAFIIQLFVFKRTFDLLYVDQQLILARLAATSPPEAAKESFAPLVEITAVAEPEAEAAGLTDQAPTGAKQGDGWAEEKLSFAEEAEKKAEPAAVVPAPAGAVRAGRFLGDGALDIIGHFQFLDASLYLGTIAREPSAACISLLVFLQARSRPTRCSRTC